MISGSLNHLLECASQQDQHPTPDVRALESAFGEISEQDTERADPSIQTFTRKEGQEPSTGSSDVRATQNPRERDDASLSEKTSGIEYLPFLEFAQSHG
jgi:hypothetical protein